MGNNSKQELEEHIAALQSQLDLVYTSPMETGDYGSMSDSELYELNFLEDEIEQSLDELEGLENE